MALEDIGSAALSAGGPGTIGHPGPLQNHLQDLTINAINHLAYVSSKTCKWYKVMNQKYIVQSQLHLFIMFDNQIVQSWLFTRPPESIVSQPTVNWHILKLVHHGAAMIYHEYFFVGNLFSLIQILNFVTSWTLWQGRVQRGWGRENRKHKVLRASQGKGCRLLWIRYMASFPLSITLNWILIASNKTTNNNHNNCIQY